MQRQPEHSEDALLARVDPELRDGAQQILAHPLPDPLTHDAVLKMRAAAPPPASPLPTPRIEPRVVPGANGHPDVRIAVIGARTTGARRPAVLHIHGGGFLVGRSQDTYAASQRLAEALDCVVVEVEYRLSPETRFPGPLEDCYTALLWLHAQADALGVDRTRIAVMGESAGGGLAAMLAIAGRDRGQVPLCCQILIYPMLDDRTGSTRAVPPFIGTIGWNAQANRYGWSALLGQPAGGARVPPRAPSPTPGSACCGRPSPPPEPPPPQNSCERAQPMIRIAQSITKSNDEGEDCDARFRADHRRDCVPDLRFAAVVAGAAGCFLRGDGRFARAGPAE
ncbi:alpha/beta hydrolase fold domain-containing protein [uncultured Sphingomonas sp.]|uniref:alpha/beta hydrolase n=1 Tax=uncultured Sphingomonas sp. TaxID=158754 RepID=UPI0025D527F9|nr:alpha/beta hydrolase fold domain-containing protein [uncultured Sphingomonas sp.]